MTAGDARQWYRDHFSADRIFVVAVGDFDPAELEGKLEALLGKIPNLRLGAVPEPGAFPMGPSGSPHHPGARSVAGDDLSEGRLCGARAGEG